jgi:DNA-binding NtrC family response regulator
MFIAARELERDVSAAAQCGANVLITGSDAVTRRAIAERIHQESGEVGALLIVSAGKHHLATDGDSTVFIEDVSCLTPAHQLELLQILENRWVIDLCRGRIIAGSKVRLYDMVVEGRFNVALFYRLNMIHIAVPSHEL